MFVWLRQRSLLCLLLLFAAGATAANAQTFTVVSVQGSRPSFGTVGAASNGNTTYRISPSGSVSVIQGNGGSTPSGTRDGATVTVKCTGSSCSSSQAMLKIARTGPLTGRALSLTSFFVESSELSVDWIANQADGSLQVRLTGFSNGGEKDVQVGADMTISGDNASTSTSASAGWSVNIAKWPTVPHMPGTRTGTAIATVRKAISATSTAMSFGAISRPPSGIGTVIISPSDGSRTAGPLTPPGLRPGMAYGRGTVTVTGQSGTTINITTPSSFALSNGGSYLLAAPVLSSSNPITLSGSSMTVGVGGALVVPSNAAVGLYNGTITLTVSYN
jgi:hypothetical protein